MLLTGSITRAAILFITGLAVASLWLISNYSVVTRCDDWEAWTRFKESFVRESGRVVDTSSPRQHTVSEGQAYALFFSLVANERTTFDAILRWTEDNLAQGDLTAHLPAWNWGRRDDGNWGVLDFNPASDADLWLAYTLAEAGRLWSDPELSALGATITDRIMREEVREIPDLGPSLLPGPTGFQSAEETWRLNPSYVPLQVVRRLATLFPDRAWPAVVDSSLRLLTESFHQGFAPNWVQFRTGHGFLVDAQTAGIGSYDAIRVYLWSGMLAKGDPAREALLRQLTGMTDYVLQQGAPPERVDTLSGQVSGTGSTGFSAALLPLLQSAGASRAVSEQLQRIAAKPPEAEPQAYYARALALFGMGYHTGRFHFAADGTLLPDWNRRCVRLLRR